MCIFVKSIHVRHVKHLEILRLEAGDGFSVFQIVQTAIFALIYTPSNKLISVILKEKQVLLLKCF